MSIRRVSGILVSTVLVSVCLYLWEKSAARNTSSSSNSNNTDKGALSQNTSNSIPSNIPVGLDQLIGNTPLVKINSLSNATGCSILAKLELANPGGSAKDRVALAIINDAEARGLIRPHRGDAIFEGTSGSTGISIAMLARARGYNAHIALPNDTSREKVQLLTSLGATVYELPPASIVDENQYVNFARRKAEEINAKAKDENSPHALFADQFENEANWRTHFENTGPEIWNQTQGNIDLFVTSAGTGGTIAGVSSYLKRQSQHSAKPFRTILADPQGSGFFSRIKYGVMFSPTEREGTRRRHQVDTLVEGVGLNRITANFAAAEPYIDDAVRVSDSDALKMAKWLAQNDGFFVGSSSAVNAVAAYKCAKALGPGHVIVTIFCDSGARHLSKFWKEAGECDVFHSLAELDDHVDS